MTKLKLAITIALLLFSIHTFSQNYLNRINTNLEFEKLSGTPLTNKYGNVKAIKVVYDLKTKKLYYLNTNNYKNHYCFCEKELNYIDGCGNFLKCNYSNGKQRKYLLANLNFFQSLNKYVLEISPTDLMREDDIVTIYNLTKESSFIDKLFFFINNPRLQATCSQLNEKISTISPIEIYGKLSYQAISKYKNVGTLKFVNDIESQKNEIHKNDIIVLKRIPNYLPPVAGVIVTEFQTPLSHISILGLNRKIPICAYTKAFEAEELLSHKDQQVCFTVKADTFYIAADATKFQVKENVKIEIEQDLTVDSLINIESLDVTSSSFVGSKAANFAELYKISKKANFKTPEHAFAIPFYFYKQHIIKSKVLVLIDKLIELEPDDSKMQNEYLEQIRKKIENTKIDKDLLDDVEYKIGQYDDFKKFRFRSSTNAEDINGFSGAGLYASKTNKLNSKNKSIENTIKTVWASNWSEKAFHEREYYNIDQKNVAMGILVHRSFPNEGVNGVAITKNIYRKNSNGFLVNAQLGNENVVDPSSGIICDQFLCFPQESNKIYKDKVVIDVITYSSLNGNSLVMSEDEIQNLANQLDIIKKHFTGKIDKWTYTRIGYDVEFKIDGENRQLYIKQVRPYND
jgi:phosphoenolpyruvate synthase/pyruvate phosphate dikinase